MRTIKIKAGTNISDWFLPSQDELIKMQEELYDYGVGDFNGDSFYWSSTETSSTTAFSYMFGDHDGRTDTLKSDIWHPVRACRSFTSDISYGLRSVGPASGWIFYRDGSYYLEAAPNDQSNQIWSNVIEYAVGDTSTVIGTGQANTTLILNQSELINDWNLPSLDELTAIYNNLKVYGVGNFTEGFAEYWSSYTNYKSADMAYKVDFSDGTDGEYYKNWDNYHVRASRSFSTNNIYTLRSSGPGGGLIYYDIDNGGGNHTYFEAAPYDQSTGYVWSNIDNTALSDTSTGIGAGTVNTNLILTQDGHLYSAAKLCTDYTSIYAQTSSAAKVCDNYSVIVYDNSNKLKLNLSVPNKIKIGGV